MISLIRIGERAWRRGRRCGGQWIRFLWRRRLPPLKFRSADMQEATSSTREHPPTKRTASYVPRPVPRDGADREVFPKDGTLRERSVFLPTSSASHLEQGTSKRKPSIELGSSPKRGRRDVSCVPGVKCGWGILVDLGTSILIFCLKMGTPKLNQSGMWKDPNLPTMGPGIQSPMMGLGMMGLGMMGPGMTQSDDFFRNRRWLRRGPAKFGLLTNRQAQPDCHSY